ncbi:N-acetylmuramate alpha-1-phosphate uridylyltransferase MurU [Caldimonas tepidiphila]|uniref:N-acetylmuramate alpha-1-phosphate uridylyltransferase MurU n=1 Tax=Caldimonas tepidiphila TaxID=2315841 RepID=UPI000E5B32CB|nr:nucleotidyltransferase family protein [Caldimonas tepidiphila]
MPNLPAMILAAGRGERMRPLTDATPKPLLKVRGKPLIEWHLEALARDGVREVVINTAWLGDRIPAALGDGARWGLAIRYSMEGREHGGALETAGGIATALPLIGSERFWLLAGDVFVPGFRFDAQAAERFAESERLAQLWLVPNPEHNPRGDFALGADGLARADGEPRWTYSTIALLHAGLLAGVAAGQKAALRPCLERAMQAGHVAAQVYEGAWTDVGTPQRLAQLQD